MWSLKPSSMSGNLAVGSAELIRLLTKMAETGHSDNLCAVVVAQSMDWVSECSSGRSRLLDRPLEHSVCFHALNFKEYSMGHRANRFCELLRPRTPSPSQRICRLCSKRKAKFCFRGRIKADHDHNLCQQCYRSLREHNRNRNPWWPRNTSPHNQ